MPKTKTQYVCQQCNRITPRYFGKCPQCGAFNSMVEEIVEEPSKTAARAPSAGCGHRPRL
ncbi:MAG: hypothetical protein ACT4QE_21280 [Anaerolineales bacterium]